MNDRTSSPMVGAGATRPLILVVEDEPALLRAFTREIQRGGFDVTPLADGESALVALEGRPHEAILCDISLPGMDGLALLRRVRERDLDIPVVFVTGYPSLDSAIQAVEHGALRYLVKPVEAADLVQIVGQACKLHQVARIKRQVAEYLGTTDRQHGDLAGLEASFQRCLSSFQMAYQPLVQWRERKIAAYEALFRSVEPRLPHPAAVLAAAERLGRVRDMGRAIRARIAADLAVLPGETDCFLNLHPLDLLDDDLVSPDAPLSRFASRVVLEITERAALEEHASIKDRITLLRAMGFRIAIDDLGAGYAGLTYFALLAPDVVKFDMSLVRTIHLEEVKRKLVASLCGLCRDLGMKVVAEGVETVEERDVLVELGCDYLQGFLLARPGDPFPHVVRWE